jgi:hypothetical protein
VDFRITENASSSLADGKTPENHFFLLFEAHNITDLNRDNFLHNLFFNSILTEDTANDQVQPELIFDSEA